MVTVQCRTCGRVAYKRGPCPTCRVFGEYGPTDVVEIHLHGTLAKTQRELARWRKEALMLRGIYRDAMREADELRRLKHRADIVAGAMESWLAAMGRKIEWLMGRGER